MKRLRYISTFAEPMDRAAVEALAAQARQHNEREGITGILISSGQIFFQIIEGPDEKVDALFSRIAKDRRHREVLVLSVEQGDFTRLCPDWAMRKIDLGAEAADRSAPIRALLRMAYVQRQLVDEAISALEAYTWRGFIDAEFEALASDGTDAG